MSRTIGAMYPRKSLPGGGLASAVASPRRGAGRALPIRLVASDLDGTLLHSDGTISPRAVNAVQALVQVGIVFVVATGRPPRRTVPLLSDLGFGALAICGNGSILYDLGSRSAPDIRRMGARVAAQLVHDIREAMPGCAFAAELGLRVAREADYLLFWPEAEEVLVASGSELAKQRPSKLMVQHDGMRFSDLFKHVQSIVADRATVSHSTMSFVEISAKGVDKASALRRLCRRLGITKDEVMAIGDMPNDLPMLRWAGRAIAVANADAEVIAAADEVAASNDADGVALALEALLEKGI